MTCLTWNPMGEIQGGPIILLTSVNMFEGMNFLKEMVNTALLIIFHEI